MVESLPALSLMVRWALWLAWACVVPSVAVFFHKDVGESPFAPSVEGIDSGQLNVSEKSDLVSDAMHRCKKIAFVHIQKTGGTTLLSLFGKGHTHLGSDSIPAESAMPHGLQVLEKLFLGASGVSVDAMELRKKIGARQWEDAYTVSFVRDPYDYFASYYFFSLWSVARKSGKTSSLLETSLDAEDALLYTSGNFLDGPAGCVENVASPVNVSPKPSDSIQYFTRKSCELVATHFASDFKTFGFDIERCPH
eukprot:TRINITY_DN2361_c0_g1_i3.p1 TRINITY_DN2361_c0_g1~~TRINITY_DN2361_c0_g1_i3.p1  ORF type:complete len:264 (+),score=40.07 TRINITY_DN2361_c0_g1_i3:42-794(+)